MMISTKGRYALRVMLDLADHNTGDYIPLKDIAQRQEISVKYLENILASLSRANLVDATRGKGGGYRLCRPPKDYAAGEILRLAEGSLASVSCLRGEQKGCEKAGHCRALPLWEGLDQVIDQYLDSVSLADLQKVEETPYRMAKAPCGGRVLFRGQGREEEREQNLSISY